MKEIRVYVIDCAHYEGCEDLRAVSDLRFIEIAEQQGNVWSLMGFQTNWNYWGSTCFDAESTYIRFIEVECAESIDFEEWEIPFVKLD